jgi:hypothetical protein
MAGNRLPAAPRGRAARPAYGQGFRVVMSGGDPAANQTRSINCVIDHSWRNASVVRCKKDQENWLVGWR